MEPISALFIFAFGALIGAIITNLVWKNKK